MSKKCYACPGLVVTEPNPWCAGYKISMDKTGSLHYIILVYNKFLCVMKIAFVMVGLDLVGCPRYSRIGLERISVGSSTCSENE